MAPSSLRLPTTVAELTALPPAVIASAAAVVAAGLVVAFFAARMLAGGAGGGASRRRRRHALGTAAALGLERGRMKEVTVPLGGPGAGAEATILLVRTSRGVLRAMGARCPHYNLKLVDGIVSGDRVMCYAHAACFSSETGDIEDGPSLDRVPSYAVTEENGQIFVELPEPASKGAALPTREEPHFCAQAAGDARNFVVVGAGPAAQGCAEELRRNGYTGRITLLTREPLAFAYDRVALSKKMGDPAAPLREPAFYERLSISVRTGVTATALNVAAKEVVLSTGEAVKYDKLLCASGGPARTYRADRKEPGPPPIAGAELDNIFPLRDAGHAQAVSAVLSRFKAAAAGAGGASAARVVIVGSSFIGMEAASYLLQNKLATDVSVVGMEDVPMERVLGRNVGEMLLKIGAAKGVKFHMRCTVGRFVAGADGRSVVAVELMQAGSLIATLPADLVIIGVGIVPAVEYLRGAAGVTVHEAAPGGVAVDEFLCAGPEDVFAAGDIAYLPYPHAEAGAEAPRVRIEHWDVALDQGRCAARNMLGARAAYAAVPFFWTSVFGKNLRSAGYCHKPAFLFRADAGDEIITHGSLDPAAGGKASVFYVVGGRVASVVTCNRDPEAAAAAELIRMRRMPAPEALRGSGEVSLVDELRRAHAEEAQREGAAGAGAGAGAAAAAAGAEAAARKRRVSAS